MIRPNPEKWGQTLANLREQSIQADHARTRERFLALYMIGMRQSNATRWAAEIGRDPETVMSWIHAYNAEGPAALRYARTGGRTPLFAPKR